LRLLRYGYDDGYLACKVEPVAEGFYHVSRGSVSTCERDFVQFVDSVIDILKVDCFARVGGSSLSSLGQAGASSSDNSEVTGEGEVARPAPFSGLDYADVFSDEESDGVPEDVGGKFAEGAASSGVFMGSIAFAVFPAPVVPQGVSYDVEHVRGIRDWLECDGIHLPARAYPCVYWATVAHAHLTVDAKKIKEMIRVFELIGDVAIKHYQSAYVLSSGGCVADYNVLSTRATNKALAALYIKCGLWELSNMQGLSRGSGAVANMMEAFIGVVHVYAAERDCIRLVQLLGLVPSGRPYPMLFEPGLDLQGLSSAQLRRALAMVAEGLL